MDDETADVPPLNRGTRAANLEQAIHISSKNASIVFILSCCVQYFLKVAVAVLIVWALVIR